MEGSLDETHTNGGPIPMDGLPGGVQSLIEELQAHAGLSPLRFGIIGMGFMGYEHMRFLKFLEREGVARVTMVADPASEQLALAAKEGKVATSTDYMDLLSSPDVDAVIIAAPNYTHIDVLRAAVRAVPPKHILCEKPLCISEAECLQARSLVAQMPPGRIFWMGMEYRYMPMVADLVSRVDRGDIGSVKMLHIREHRFPFMKKVGNWNRFNCYTGGTLVEKCCHFFDLMRRIIGAEPLRLFCSGGHDVNHMTEASGPDGQRPDMLDNAYCIVEFSGGVRACLDLCMFAEDRQVEEVTAIGSHGKLFATSQPELQVTFSACKADGSSAVPPPTAHVETITHKPNEELLQAGTHEGSTYFELHAFCRACREADKGSAARVAVCLEDGIRAVQMGLAAQESIRLGRAVDLKQAHAGEVFATRSPKRRKTDADNEGAAGGKGDVLHAEAR